MVAEWMSVSEKPPTARSMSDNVCGRGMFGAAPLYPSVDEIEEVPVEDWAA